MGLCGFSPKVSAVVAGLLTLLQGVFWSILGTLSLLLYSCSISASGELTPQFYRLYLVYLYKIGSRVAGRTYAWVLIYLILSVLWVIGALLLVIASMSEIRGIKGVVLRAPWLVLTSVFVILDVITSVFYSIDISYTSNLEELLAFVGLVVEPDTINSSSTSSTFGYLTMAPSILAVVIFSRVIVGWALNLVLLIHVAQDAKNEEKPPPPRLPEPREPYQQYLKKLSTIGPVPDVKWDPYQRKRSDLPVLKPLEKPSPPNERKRKQSDYQQYMFYAKKSSQLNYLDDIRSEPPTPAIGAEPTTTELWRVAATQAETQGEANNWSTDRSSSVSVPKPDYW